MFLTDSMNPTKQELAAQVAAEREAWEAAGNKATIIPAGVGVYEVKPLSTTTKGVARKNPTRKEDIEEQD